MATARKKTRKKAPMTLFGMQIRKSPKAHKMAIALNMSGVAMNIPTADVIVRTLEKMETMGGKFDLETACKIRARVEEEYEQLEQDFKNLTNKNK